MTEVGIDITTAQPRLLTPELVEGVDVVITMGCGDTCPYFPGKRYADWPLTDPAGQSLDLVRQVRDEIRNHAQTLVAELIVAE